jgi:chitin disaccharide deacetylase
MITMTRLSQKCLFDEIQEAVEQYLPPGVNWEDHFSGLDPKIIMGAPPTQGLPPFTEAKSLGPNPVLKKLGFSAEDRLLIVHVDDLGLTQSNVEGFAELVDFGLVTSGSVMMPTAWAPLAAAFARQHPEADVGIHMTLTSEWECNRWSPLSTIDPASGLIDPDGYMWQHGEDLFPRTKGGAVRQEMEIQAQRAIAMGIDPTHFDSHQFVALQTYLIDYMRVCLAHHVPPIFIRRDKAGFEAISGIDPGMISMAVIMVKVLELFKIPLLDNMYMMPLEQPEMRLQNTKDILHQLVPGVTLFICHATKESPELAAITPDAAGRFADYKTWMREELRTHIKDEGIHLIGWRALKNLMPA